MCVCEREKGGRERRELCAPICKKSRVMTFLPPPCLCLTLTHLPGLQDSAQTTTQQQKGLAGSLIGDGHLTIEPCCGKTGSGVWRRESTLPIFLT